MAIKEDYQDDIEMIKLTIEALENNRKDEIEVKELIPLLKIQIDLLTELQELVEQDKESFIEKEKGGKQKKSAKIQELKQRSKYNQAKIKKLFDALDRKENSKDDIDYIQ